MTTAKALCYSFALGTLMWAVLSGADSWLDAQKAAAAVSIEAREPEMVRISRPAKRIPICKTPAAEGAPTCLTEAEHRTLIRLALLEALGRVPQK